MLKLITSRKLSTFVDQILKAFNQPEEHPGIRNESPHVTLKLTKYEISIPESSLLDVPASTFESEPSPARPIVGGGFAGADKNDQGIDPKCLASLCG